LLEKVKQLCSKGRRKESRCIFCLLNKIIRDKSHWSLEEEEQEDAVIKPPQKVQELYGHSFLAVCLVVDPSVGLYVPILIFNLMQ
jgi:hypothetical protein